MIKSVSPVLLLAFALGCTNPEVPQPTKSAKEVHVSPVAVVGKMAEMTRKTPTRWKGLSFSAQEVSVADSSGNKPRPQ